MHVKPSFSSLGSGIVGFHDAKHNSFAACRPQITDNKLSSAQGPLNGNKWQQSYDRTNSFNIFPALLPRRGNKQFRHLQTPSIKLLRCFSHCHRPAGTSCHWCCRSSVTSMMAKGTHQHQQWPVWSMRRKSHQRILRDCYRGLPQRRLVQRRSSRQGAVGLGGHHGRTLVITGAVPGQNFGSLLNCTWSRLCWASGEGSNSRTGFC